VRSLYLSLLIPIVVLTPAVGSGQSESSRIYVRRIEFQGTAGIADEVLRRQLTLPEGTFLNTVALEQSRRRLEELPYVGEARTLLQPVADTANQVDVIFAIAQVPARAYGGGAAYSGSQRVSVHGFFTHENLLGKGQRLSATANVSEFRRLAEVSHTEHFLGSLPVSRTVALASRRVDRLTADTSEVHADLAEARLDFSYRTAEQQSISFGLALNDVELATGAVVSEQWLEWVQSNGDPVARGPDSSTSFRAAELRLRWQEDTRSPSVFPARGRTQTAGLRSAIPGSEVEYYVLDYALTTHWPLRGRWEARLDATLAYGAAFGAATTSLPPYLNLFAGGLDSVRGYRDGGLGPKDSLANPYGGNLLVAGQFELMLPLPDTWRQRTRIGIFYDVGNVFATEEVAFADSVGDRPDYTFAVSRLRRSVGISARILLPFGLVRLSYGVPLNAADDLADPFLRDDTERFQVAFGVDF